MKKSKKIMIVDDEREILKIMRVFLEKDGYVHDNIVEAGGGEQCVELVENGFVPDLIIMDVMMPGLDGYRACGMLKSDKKYSKLKVLFYSALPEDEIKEKFRMYGAAGYMMKGEEAGVMLEKITKILGV